MPLRIMIGTSRERYPFWWSVVQEDEEPVSYASGIAFSAQEAMDVAVATRKAIYKKHPNWKYFKAPT